MVSPNTMNSEASVLDIVSFGYRQAFQNLGASTKLAIPTIIVGALLGIVQYYQSGLPPRDPKQLIFVLGMLPLGLVNMYNSYCISRYARDRYFDEVQESLLSYWIPNGTFVKVILLGILGALAFIPVGFVGIIGLVLLIIPGIIWFTYAAMTYNVIFALLLDNPTRGVRGNIKEGFRLLKGNIPRTIGLSLLSGLVYVVITFPMSLLRGILNAIARILHSDVASIGLIGLSAGINAIVCWFAITVGLCGTMFVLYRYIEDLKARHGDLDDFNSDNSPSNLPPGMFGVNR
jgi:hypothetical protein